MILGKEEEILKEYHWTNIVIKLTNKRLVISEKEKVVNFRFLSKTLQAQC
jgi:hypothetical protein